MTEQPKTVAELFEEGDPIDEALRLGVADARRLHKRLGVPMATWRDGRVVMVHPEDLEVETDAEAGDISRER